MSLKKRIRNGETVTGCWLNLGSSVTAEIVGRAGFDWVLIDIEHGAGGEQDLLHQLQSLHHTPASSIVRVESHNRQRIQRALDFGAEGIMCPQIRNIQQATMAANALRYPPLGSRGVAKMVRATGFGTDFDEYRQKSTETITGIIQVETTEILNSLNEIAELEAVDVLFIGPSDLSMALGIFGEYDHPTFTDAVKATALAAKRAGKAAGILLSTPKDFKKYYQMGIRVIACGADGLFVNEGARKMSDALRDEKNHSEMTR
jgi:4-hydroxy-2-oxoheptanedioate aldolase